MSNNGDGRDPCRINDLAGRVESISVGSSSPPTVASYAYLGAARLVGTTLDQAALVSAVYSGTTYPGLDSFNRPSNWYWARSGGASGGFYNTSIAYDENSNPTSTIDHVHTRAATGARPFDVVYTLDGLNRLTMADEGHASGSPLVRVPLSFAAPGRAYLRRIRDSAW